MPYWSLYYHFVWGVEHRLPLILPTFEKRLHSAVASKAIDLGAIVHAVEGSKIMSIWQSPYRRKYLWPVLLGKSRGILLISSINIIEPGFTFYWQEEYGVMSFGEKDSPFVVHYVHEQRNHHCQGSAIEILERVD